MENKVALFLELADLFKKSGYRLYLVGGTVRDFLMQKELTDMDAVTDAKPEIMESILKDIKHDNTFAKFGSIKAIYKNVKFDITTLRKEKAYSDSRHPNSIEFIDNPKEDVVRRDFTINAMYLDEELNLLDFVGGKQDLENHCIRMMGEPNKRLSEDPLRIIRAIRFSLSFNFEIEADLKKAIKENISLLDNLNPVKVEQDIGKIACDDYDKISKMFNEFGIKHLLDVVCLKH